MYDMFSREFQSETPEYYVSKCDQWAELYCGRFVLQEKAIKSGRVTSELLSMFCSNFYAV